MLRDRANNFFLTPLLALSNSLLVRKPMSNMTQKTLRLAAKPIADMVVTVVTVTVDTIILTLYYSKY